MGLALQEKGRLDEAIEFHKKSCLLDAEFPDAHRSLSFAFLSDGKMKEGWEEYEWRWKTEDFIHQKRDFSQPFWDGSSLKGKKLLIFTEQGVGDEIMFASCLIDVINRADLCIVECSDRLVPLFSRSFPEAKITAKFGSYKSSSIFHV